MEKSTRTGLIIFCFSLLILACTVRSGVLVDMSFLPRFFLLSLILPVLLLTTARRIFFVRISFFETAFVLFYLWSLVSAFWAIDPAETFVQAQLIFLSLLLFLITFSVVRTHPGFELLFIKTCLALLLLSYGLAFYKMSVLQVYNPYSILSVSANNNLYSGFLILSLSLTFSGFILLRGIWKYLSAITGIFALFFIVILQSRAAYLGIFAALFISIIFLLLRYRKVFSIRNIITGSVSLVVLAAGIFLFTRYLDETRRQYFIEKISIWNYFTSYEELQAKKIEDLNSANPDDHSKIAPFDYAENYYSNANFRVIFWKKSLGLIQSHPVTGVGSGNWRLAIPSVKDPPNPEHTIMNFTYSEPHNEWIRILSETGIPGFILAVFLFFIPPLLVFWRVLFSAVKPPVETLFYASFILGLYLFACFDFPLRRIEHNVILWSVFAFMIHKVSPYGKSVKVFLPERKALIIILFLIPTVFTILIAVARVRGEYYTLQIFRNEHRNDGKVIAGCRKAENVFYHITPNTLPVSWFEGVAHFRMGEIKDAERCFRKALKSTPYEVRVLNDYSTALFNNGNTEAAISVLQKTLYLDPFFDDARLNLGVLYYLTGRRSDALFHVRKCRDSHRKQELLLEMN